MAHAPKTQEEIDRENVEHQFTYQAPKGDQQARYGALRASAKQFALAILDNVPPSADRTAAIRKLREAVFTANAAIALEGLTHGARTPKAEPEVAAQ